MQDCAAACNIWVSSRQRFFPHFQCPFVDRLRFGQPPLSIIEAGKVVAAGGNIRVPGRKRLLPDLDRALEKWLRLAEAALGKGMKRQVAEATRDERMSSGQGLLAYFEGKSVEALGFRNAGATRHHYRRNDHDVPG